MLFLFLASVALADWKPVWKLETQGAPKTVFFDASSGKIFLSVESGKKAWVERISYEGKSEETIAKGDAPAGPLRAYGGRIYWGAGGKVFSFGPEGEKKKVEAEIPSITDIALDAKGILYVASEAGVYSQGKVIFSKPVTSLLYLQSLHIFSQGKIIVDSKESLFCDCLGLERAPLGGWFTAEGKKIVRRNGKTKEVLLVASSPPGRLGYLYRRETKEDLLLVPRPDGKVLEAYRAP